MPENPGTEDSSDQAVNSAGKGTHIYTYDELNRMVTSNIAKTESTYTYDTLGNLVSEKVKAGILIVTTQGRGSVSIMDGYRIDRTLLTFGDMRAILAGLQSLDSVSGTQRYRQFMEKLYMKNFDVLASNRHILIEWSSWYKFTLAPKIALLQGAIERQERVPFRYFAPKGESRGRSFL